MQALLNPRRNARYARSLLRALLGAMVFALPLFMTMEMWELGVAMDRMRLALLLLLSSPALVALSFYAGFEKTFSFIENLLDAFAAIAISTVACFIVLVVFGQLQPGMPANEIVGKLAVLSLPASIGALLADKQFNDNADEEAREEGRSRHSFSSRLFVMGVGAIFLALNVAPTEEVQIIAAAMSPLHAVLLAVVSIAALHVILKVVDRESGRNARLARRTLAGYGLCLLLCWYVLWVFSRLDGVGFAESVERTVVLSFPAALGAGAARLILGSTPDE